MNKIKSYDECWLRYAPIESDSLKNLLSKIHIKFNFPDHAKIANTALNELRNAFTSFSGQAPDVSQFKYDNNLFVVFISAIKDAQINPVDLIEVNTLQKDGYLIKSQKTNNTSYPMILIASKAESGLLYGVFSFLRHICLNKSLDDLFLIDSPKCDLRMINHWDNLDGSIERGYAGRSIFYENNLLTQNLERIRDYARLLSSIGINCIVVNNVNVHKQETLLIGSKLDMTIRLADIFRIFGIKLYLSINYAAPVESNELNTADPLDSDVIIWWKNAVSAIYDKIPDFGGFLVKADSEHRPGPNTYNRSHAQGANMLASILKPFGGHLIWRCFVYNCKQDWRDTVTDRAKAAYEIYMPHDGEFLDNVILQIKNGPMDFQVREPVSPLLGAMKETNQILEFQITQEYTGQQQHLCYLIPQWKEVLDFDTHAKGKNSTINRVVDGSLWSKNLNGMAAVVNIGKDFSWTGHYLAQANLYGYGRLAWNPDLTSEDISSEWITLTFEDNSKVLSSLTGILMNSWSVYESYNAPLGIGWMVNPNHHYGPSVDGYEYSPWGTYHRADLENIGVSRTSLNGTGYTLQYFKENQALYDNVDTCPEELLLFFHRLPYTFNLKNGKTLIQHIYDTHFQGKADAEAFVEKWEALRGEVDEVRFEHILRRFKTQASHAREWCDTINSYFYRKTGIADILGRKIY